MNEVEGGGVGVKYPGKNVCQVRKAQIRCPFLGASSPILTLGVNPFPYIFIFRTDLLRFLPEVFAPLRQVLHSDPLLLRKRCDLQNNNGEKRGGESVQHAVHRRNNVFAGNMLFAQQTDMPTERYSRKKKN